VQAPLRLEPEPGSLDALDALDALQLSVAMWATTERFWLLTGLRGLRLGAGVVLGRVGDGVALVVGVGVVVVGVVVTGTVVATGVGVAAGVVLAAGVVEVGAGVPEVVVVAGGVGVDVVVVVVGGGGVVEVVVVVGGAVVLESPLHRPWAKHGSTTRSLFIGMVGPVMIQRFSGE
jgi:hypothetical protein